MIKITVIAVGKIKENSFAEAIKEYEKRLGAFCELSVSEIKPHPLPDDPSDAQISSALKAEEKSILAKIPKDADVFPLCIEGRSMSSGEFAGEIKRRKDAGRNICFIIGGSYGLGDGVKRSGAGISFSEMTFPHRLFRLMLLEQIYRAFTIISNKKYHK